MPAGGALAHPSGVAGCSSSRLRMMQGPLTSSQTERRLVDAKVQMVCSSAIQISAISTCRREPMMEKVSIRVTLPNQAGLQDELMCITSLLLLGTLLWDPRSGGGCLAYENR